MVVKKQESNGQWDFVIKENISVVKIGIDLTSVNAMDLGAGDKFSLQQRPGNGVSPPGVAPATATDESRAAMSGIHEKREGGFGVRGGGGCYGAPMRHDFAPTT